jgi:hypothetical protein
MARERSRALWLLAAVGGVVLAGCGSNMSSGRVTRASGLFDIAAVVSSASCSISGTRSTRTVVDPCIFVLGDGRRFSCPPAFARAVQSADTLEHAKACRRLSPLAIPASWRPGFAALQNTGSCLTRQGFRVSGGPSLGEPHRRPETPIGELVIQNGNAPILVGYYQDSRIAQQFEPTAIRNVRRVGGQVQRRDAVIVVWARPPTSQQRNTVDACAFA